MTTRVLVSITAGGLCRAELDASSPATLTFVLKGVAVRCLACGPPGSAILYAGTEQMGVLRSPDAGLTWQPLGLTGKTITALAASPIVPDLLYAGTLPPHLFTSVDGGRTWSELAGFRRIRSRRFWFSPAAWPFTPCVQAIALSPADPHRLVVGIELGATVLSTDGGVTWTNHRRHALRDCHGLVFHSTDGRWVYEAGGTGGGAAYSRDGGNTWANAGRGLDRHYGWAVAADALDPSIWYVAVAPGPRQAHGVGNAAACIFRHDGTRWQRLTGGLPQPLPSMPYALLTEPGVAGSLYAGLRSGAIWHSPDYGDSWTQVPVRLSAIDRGLVVQTQPADAAT